MTKKIILAIGNIPHHPTQHVRNLLHREGHEVTIEHTPASVWSEFPSQVIQLVEDVQVGKTFSRDAAAAFRRLAPECISTDFYDILSWFEEQDALARAELSVLVGRDLIKQLAVQFHFRSVVEDVHPPRTMAVVIGEVSLAVDVRIRDGFTALTSEVNLVLSPVEHYGVPQFWFYRDGLAHLHQG